MPVLTGFPPAISPHSATFNRTRSSISHARKTRTDPASVMYSYRVFRRANPGLDTRDGVEFIGYQMVKMGDYPGSIELLKANASDYPQSASAQYSLGRAYGAAGQKPAARAGMRRALQIDPKFTKASSGLDALR
jgi:tetratricopeptide (TPR) repeat protein